MYVCAYLSLALSMPREEPPVKIRSLQFFHIGWRDSRYGIRIARPEGTVESIRVCTGTQHQLVYIGQWLVYTHAVSISTHSVSVSIMYMCTHKIFSNIHIGQAGASPPSCTTGSNFYMYIHVHVGRYIVYIYMYNYDI